MTEIQKEKREFIYLGRREGLKTDADLFILREKYEQNPVAQQADNDAGWYGLGKKRPANIVGGVYTMDALVTGEKMTLYLGTIQYVGLYIDEEARQFWTAKDVAFAQKKAAARAQKKAADEEAFDKMLAPLVAVHRKVGWRDERAFEEALIVRLRYLANRKD